MPPHSTKVPSVGSAPFGADERLYRGVRPDEWTSEALSKTLAWVEFPRMSVDRGAFGTAADMVAAHPTFGVVSFLVGDIPAVLPESVPAGSNQRQVFFALDHCPEFANAAHTHVLALDSSGNELVVVKSKELKGKFREAVRRHARTELIPIGLAFIPINSPQP